MLAHFSYGKEESFGVWSLHGNSHFGFIIYELEFVLILVVHTHHENVFATKISTYTVYMVTACK